ncbi:MAG: tyrosine-type recombinase/integrase [Bacteroidales bacterium]|nr:tyrosine-type recombinase/integrase [Bacteroidales bacterium]
MTSRNKNTTSKPKIKSAETKDMSSLWRKYLPGFKSYILMERSHSVNTLSAYLDDCDKFFTFMETTYPNITPQKTQTFHLRRFLTAIVQGMKGNSEVRLLKVSTQRRIISGIRSFFKYLLLEDEIDTDPCSQLETAKMEKKLPVVLSDNEIQTMLSAIDKSSFQGYRNALIIEVLYSCGLRISELLNLRKSDVFFQFEYIKVLGKGNKERLVPICQTALEHIRYFIDNHLCHIPTDNKNKDYIFLNHRGKKLTRQYAFMMIKETAKAAGITKNIHPHTLRHSFATELIKGGANIIAVKDMMGHSSVVSTEIYTHLDTAHLRETIMLYHPHYNKTPWKKTPSRGRQKKW